MEAVRDSTLLDSALLRPFRPALNRVLPGFPTEETADFVIDASVVLGEGVLRLPQSVGGSGAVLLLEDLHWADPDTVALLDYLGGALTTSPAAAVPADLPFQLLSVGSEIPDPTRQLVERYGLVGGRAVLIRPDGCVTWLSKDANADPVDELRQAVAHKVLGSRYSLPISWRRSPDSSRRSVRKPALWSDCAHPHRRRG